MGPLNLGVTSGLLNPFFTNLTLGLLSQFSFHCSTVSTSLSKYKFLESKFNLDFKFSDFNDHSELGFFRTVARKAKNM